VPTSGLTSGGTRIEVSGAWFDQKLEYGLVPRCKIGEKVVRAIFISTVRLVCHSPPNDNTVAPLPVKVSLNGADWVDSGFHFSYYDQPNVHDLSPKLGHMAGGTELFLMGDHFSNITDPENVKCMFSLVNDANGTSSPKYLPARYLNETNMGCFSPPGYRGGDQVYVQLSFNGADFTPQNPNLVHTFYNIFGSFPQSGPADAYDEVILVKGAGFRAGSRVMCVLNNTAIAPVEVTWNLIKCPMALPNKDPNAIGNVKFGLQFDKSYNDFGNFAYYKQVGLNDIQPRIGPASGHGIIYFYGERFTDDFQGA